MNREELGKLYPIFLVDYNDSWSALFLREKKRLFGILEIGILRIEHIGSTAIPGMKAKPTIDILISLAAAASKAEIEKKMTAQGWIKMEEQKDHLMFVKGYSPEGLEKESFHVHISPEGHPKIADSLLFRDYLRTHSDAAAEYEALKMRLAEKYRNDREAYTQGKGEFIKIIIGLAKEK